MRCCQVSGGKAGQERQSGHSCGKFDGSEHAGRVQGFKALAEYPNIKIVFEQPDNDDLATAVAVAESALQANQDLNGILCSNASNPIGAARAVKNAGKAGEILIAGMDNLPETLKFLKEGVILVTNYSASGISVTGLSDIWSR